MPADDAEIFYTWEPPPSGHWAASNARIVPLERHSASGHQADPETVATEFTTSILQRADFYGSAAQIPIFIQALGEGDANGTTTPALFTHETDAVAADLGLIATDGAAANLYTGFFAAGIIETGAWVDGFITQWNADHTASAGRVPVPTRLILDSEHQPKVHRHFTKMGLVAREMIADGRWLTELIPSLGVTWFDFYASSGSPSFDDTKSLDHADNRAFSRWFQGALETALHGAMEDAIYSKFRANWPSIKCSNYNQTSYDGIDGRVREHRFPHDGWYYWSMATTPEADFSSDTTYWDQGPKGIYQETGLLGNSPFTGANWSESGSYPTKRIILADPSVIKNYQWSSGDRVVFTAGTGINTTYPFIIRSVSYEGGWIRLEDSPSTGGLDRNNDDIAGTITITNETLDAATIRVVKEELTRQSESFGGTDLLPWIAIPGWPSSSGTGYSWRAVTAVQVAQHIEDASVLGCTEFMIWFDPTLVSSDDWTALHDIIQLRHMEILPAQSQTKPGRKVSRKRG